MSKGDSTRLNPPPAPQTAKAFEKIERNLDRMRKSLKGRVKAQGMDVRSEVLADALAIEYMIKMLVGPLIGSKGTVGEDFLPISIDSCRRLLYHLGVLDQKKHEGRLKLFDEVRNQFVHNIRVETYSDCFDALGGKEKHILRLYPQNSRWKRERRLKLAVQDLANDCRKIVDEVIDAYFDKALTDARKAQAMKQYEFKAMSESVVHLFRRFRFEMKQLVESGYQLQEEDIEGFPKHLYDYWSENFHREVKSLVKTGKTREEVYAEKRQAKAVSSNTTP
jgi:hypothetical protein